MGPAAARVATGPASAGGRPLSKRSHRRCKLGLSRRMQGSMMAINCCCMAGGISSITCCIT
jgi:hypothetical protein